MLLYILAGGSFEREHSAGFALVALSESLETARENWTSSAGTGAELCLRRVSSTRFTSSLLLVTFTPAARTTHTTHGSCDLCRSSYQLCPDIPSLTSFSWKRSAVHPYSASFLVLAVMNTCKTAGPPCEVKQTEQSPREPLDLVRICRPSVGVTLRRDRLIPSLSSFVPFPLRGRGRPCSYSTLVKQKQVMNDEWMQNSCLLQQTTSWGL